MVRERPDKGVETSSRRSSDLPLFCVLSADVDEEAERPSQALHLGGEALRNVQRAVPVSLMNLVLWEASVEEDEHLLIHRPISTLYFGFT